MRKHRVFVGLGACFALYLLFEFVSLMFEVPGLFELTDIKNLAVQLAMVLVVAALIDVLLFSVPAVILQWWWRDRIKAWHLVVIGLAPVLFLYVVGEVMEFIYSPDPIDQAMDAMKTTWLSTYVFPFVAIAASFLYWHVSGLSKRKEEFESGVAD